jgi:DNA-binding NtrC family response regulator
MSDLKIFLVDDDFYYLHILEQHLINLGCSNIQLFDNGPDCLDNLSEKPDIIFLDYQMDTLTGYEVLKKIKRFDPNIYVVMVSAQEQIKPVVDALKHGAFDYLQKGDNEPQKLKDVLRRIKDVKAILENPAPGFLKKIFQFAL